MNVMLEYKKIAALADILFDKSCSESVSKIRLYALQRLNGITDWYSRENFLPSLTETIWDKKKGFIMEATTINEITSILKPSIPIYDPYADRWSFSPFHVDEEELLMWSWLTGDKSIDIIEPAQARMIFLFRKYLPAIAKELGI